MSHHTPIPLKSLQVASKAYSYYSLPDLPQFAHGGLDRLPFSIRILLEGVLRKLNNGRVSQRDVDNLAGWQAHADSRQVVPFFPGRVVLQDFTGVPVVNDLAAMRAALARSGGDPRKVNPIIPVDLVIDHSVQVDYFGSPDAFERNVALEFERNRERYEFLHWAQKAFNRFRVVPPSTGIVHQVNLEYLASSVLTEEMDGQTLVFPETLVGTDSHTTMINGLGVTGWGVGGIEAVAAMLGEPIEFLTPEVIGIKLTGRLRSGVTPTDLTLTIVQMLRKQGVVDKFVEFFGPGLSSLALADRAMIANMTPEMGATQLFFPFDRQTVDYLKLTGRPADTTALAESYYRAQRLFRDDSTPDPEFTVVLHLDLASVEPSLAGPKRPQDRVTLAMVKDGFRQALVRSKTDRGFGLTDAELSRSAPFHLNAQSGTLRHGAVVIAAITSCTNTSNPSVMIGAGLLAKKAVEKGLSVEPYVKTSLAPGSRVVTGYLEKAGLLDPLARLGFNLVGYGCTTCIGNSGPLPEEVANAITSANLVAAAVLSGNRNFEGRVHPNVQANYLASPPLVIAYALAGRIDIDLETDPLGYDPNGQPVFLKDIWPSTEEIQETISATVTPQLFADNYRVVFTGNAKWNSIRSGADLLYQWTPESTYLQEPPFFDLQDAGHGNKEIRAARVLALLGDSITTDHISPAGSISPTGAAGRYLMAQGVPISEFNSYGSRRGNDRVMTRGTFGNIRLKNHLLQGVEGSYTLHLPDEEKMNIYDASIRYRDEGVPLIVIAGKEYGTGSSRDWAAKGVLLLGVKAVIAESFERIHRSNLAGMGVLPLQFLPGENAASLGLTGRETFTITGLEKIDRPGGWVDVQVTRPDGSNFTFRTAIRIDTDTEVTYFHGGGMMNTILKKRI